MMLELLIPLHHPFQRTPPLFLLTVTMLVPFTWPTGAVIRVWSLSCNCRPPWGECIIVGLTFCPIQFRPVCTPSPHHPALPAAKIRIPLPPLHTTLRH
ncbi:hypothetical protein K438DRAFT_1806702 [Mycena galopus ATCC 62051]|nr:hypothetical protein K438DRAFT_1806702 [Mycena galopus ATCC 62051]